MKHDNPAFEEQLSALVDGRLSPDEARAVRKHLASCEECRAQYDAIASARRLLRAMPAPVVPEGLLAGIQREAAAEIARGAGPSIW
ncbi:MAG: anti-sigma factor family protein, partial [Armatimonadota bacterium]